MGMVEMRFDCTFRPIQLRGNLLQLKSIVISQVEDVLLFRRQLLHRLTNDLSKFFRFLTDLAAMELTSLNAGSSLPVVGKSSNDKVCPRFC